MLKILVTGSTGFLGYHLVKALIRKKFNVKCFVKNEQKARILPDGCEIFVGNITNKHDCYLATRGVDIICHLAAQMRKKGIPNFQYWKVNFEGTKNIVEAAKKENVKQFIHCSTASIIGPVGNQPLDERHSSYDCDNIYKLTKTEAEKFVWLNRKELPITIISPEFIYGPGCYHYLPLFMAIRKKRIAIIGNGSNFHQPTYVTDVVKGFLLAINNKKAIGEKFIIAGNEIITSKDLIMKIAQEMGIDLKLAYIPYWPIKIIFPIFSHILPIPEGAVDFFIKNHMYSIKKARNILNYEPKVNLDTGVKKTITWFKATYGQSL